MRGDKLPLPFVCTPLKQGDVVIFGASTRQSRQSAPREKQWWATGKSTLDCIVTSCRRFLSTRQ